MGPPKIKMDGGESGGGCPPPCEQSHSLYFFVTLSSAQLTPTSVGNPGPWLQQ